LTQFAQYQRNCPGDYHDESKVSQQTELFQVSSRDYVSYSNLS
jgi:hypothetical protein